jgi:Phosphoenolpyruvate phosphomutase
MHNAGGQWRAHSSSAPANSLSARALAQRAQPQAEALEEALERAERFAAAGADIVFIDALESAEEMRRLGELRGYGAAVPKMASMLEGGKTPLLRRSELEALNFKLVAYPLSLLGVSVRAMQRALQVWAALMLLLPCWPCGLLRCGCGRIVMRACRSSISSALRRPHCSISMQLLRLRRCHDHLHATAPVDSFHALRYHIAITRSALQCGWTP